MVSFKVANYINGGHYAPHHDYVMKEKDPGHVSFYQKLFLKKSIAVINLKKYITKITFSSSAFIM